MDLVTLGEALVVFSPMENGPLRFVDNYHKSMGGAEANVAIALSRLGFKTGFISKIANDEFSRYIQHQLSGNNVDISQLSMDSNLPTAVLFKERFLHKNPNVYYYRQNSAFTNLCSNDINENYIANAKILHVTGITPALSDSCKDACFTAIEYAKSNHVTISFDPNLRLKLWDKQTAKTTMLKIARYADIILPGIDEAQLILGIENVNDICDKFHEIGCKIVVIKLGEKGCIVSTHKQRINIEAFHVDNVIDTVGAGDGFNAGFLAGYLLGKPMQECAQYANGVGALATLVSGDNEGYPTLEQLHQFIGISSFIQR